MIEALSGRASGRMRAGLRVDRGDIREFLLSQTDEQLAELLCDLAFPGAAERVLDLREHGLKAGQRELAGLVDHTKAWTPRRKELLAQLLGEPFESLVAILDRQLGVRGPISHPEGGLWASAVGEVDLAVSTDVRGVLLVENLETFRTLTVLADAAWLVLHVPGGPPPAECQLIERIAALAPEIHFHAAFDLDLLASA